MGLQGPDGLQQNRASFRNSGLVGQFGGHNERHFAGIHRVIAAVQQGGFQADHRVTGQHTVLGRLADALFNSGEEVLRYAAAEHVLGKLDVLALDRLELDPDITELAVAASLLLVAALGLAALADGLAVGHARGFQRDLDTELILQLGKGDFQMLGAQAADDLLLGLGIDHEGDGGIFLNQAGQRAADLALVALLGDLDGHAVAAGGVGGCGQRHHAGGVAQGITGLGGGQLGDNADVAGGNGSSVGLLFAADDEGLAHALRLAGAGVDSVAGGGQLAGQHLDKAHLAHERVGHGLKDVGAQRGSGIGSDVDRVTVLILAHGSGGVSAGQQDVHVVQQHIQRLVVDGAAAEYGGDLAAADARGHALDDLLGGERLTLEELFHQGFVGLGDGLAHGLDQTLEAMADVGQVDLDLLAALVLKGFLAEQVDVGDGAVVQADRHDTGADAGAELDLHLLQDLEVVGVFQVGFGDKDHPRLVVFKGQLVGFLGADGDAGTAGHADQHAFGGHDTLGCAGLEIEQAGHIDEVIFDALVLNGDNAGVQRCLAADLFGVEVAGGGAVLNTAHALGRAAHVQQGFGQRGFAAASVAGDQNVADVFACIVHGTIKPLFAPGARHALRARCGVLNFTESRLSKW